jgi:hypothetical protein
VCVPVPVVVVVMQLDANKISMFCQSMHVMWSGLHQILGYIKNKNYHFYVIFIYLFIYFPIMKETKGLTGCGCGGGGAAGREQDLDVLPVGARDVVGAAPDPRIHRSTLRRHGMAHTRW